MDYFARFFWRQWTFRVLFLKKIICFLSSPHVQIRHGGLEDQPRSRGPPRDLIVMASVSVLVAAARVSVLVSEVPALSTGSLEPASVSRPASRPNLDGLGLGHPCLGLGLGLGGPGLDFNPGVHGLDSLHLCKLPFFTIFEHQIRPFYFH